MLYTAVRDTGSNVICQWYKEKRFVNKTRLNSGAVLCLLFALTILSPVLADGPDRGTPWPIHIIDDFSRGADGVKLFDLDGDGLLDLTTGWEEGGLTRIYRNPGPDRAKQPWPSLTVGKTPHVEDAAWIDLERNGISRAVVSCSEGKTRAIFVHWPPDEKPFAQPWEQSVIPASKDRMMWMFAIPAKLGLNTHGGEELVAAGKGPGAEIGWFRPMGEVRELSKYKWCPISPAGWIMSLYAIDMDGDGDQDILTTDRKGKWRGCRWLENPGEGLAEGKWKNHWVGGQDREVMFAHLADLDQDGLQDILFVTRAPDEVHWYRRLDQSGLKWEQRVIPYPQNMGSGKGVAVGDLDRDGVLDLVLSCEHANPPKSGMCWLRGVHEGEQLHWEPREISGPKGIKYDRIELLDLDADGDLDVICCEERHQKRGLGLFWYENPHQPTASQSPLTGSQSKKSSR